MHSSTSQSKRAALAAAGYAPRPVSAYELVRWQQPANGNGERRKAVCHGA